MSMIGNNELRLCKAEMKIALQEYLDARMGEYAPSVNDVVEWDHMFRVALVERKVDRDQGHTVGTSPEPAPVCGPKVCR